MTILTWGFPIGVPPGSVIVPVILVSYVCATPINDTIKRTMNNTDLVRLFTPNLHFDELHAARVHSAAHRQAAITAPRWPETSHETSTHEFHAAYHISLYEEGMCLRLIEALLPD